MKKLFSILLSVILLYSCTIGIRAINLNCPEEVGIPVHKHILVVRSSRCCDTALDRKGNHYYCYIIDRRNNLKALVTDATLIPVGELDEDVKTFYFFVLEEVRRDGGIEKLVEQFSKAETSCQCSEHRR